jgi:hypothetical protein
MIITTTLTPVRLSSARRADVRRRTLDEAILEVLPKPRLAAIRELVRHELSVRKPAASDMMHWLRLHMPTAAAQIEELTQPGDFAE